MGLVGSLLAFAVALASILYLLPTPPTSLGPPKLRNTPLNRAGPVLAAIIRKLELDGLTIIPVVQMPPVKLTLKVPLTTKRLRIVIKSTASELVFTRLRVGQVATRCIDAGRFPIDVKVDQVSTILSGSFSITATARFVPQGMNLNDESTLRPWKWTGSGRVEADIDDAAIALGVQLVCGMTPDSVPKIEVLSTNVDEGSINMLAIKGFGPWGALVTKMTPFVKGTILIRWPVKLISDFLIRDMAEGPAVDDIAEGLFKFVNKHVDVQTYDAMVDDEREKEVSTPLDASSLAPPSATSGSTESPLPPSSAASVETNSPTPTSSEAGGEVTTTVQESLPTTTNFRMHSHLIGPTRLHNFFLPDYSPPLYRPGGTRATLQSFNKLTSEIQLQLSESGLTTLSFDRASLAFDPPRSPDVSGKKKHRQKQPPVEAGIEGGDLVVTVHDLTVILESKFKIFAETAQILQWTTGLKKIGQKGRSTTTVTARTLQIRFELLGNRSRQGAPYELKATSISPFTTIVPKTVLEDSKLQLGVEVMNFITESLKTQIAAAASLVIGQFMKDAVRNYLQKAMDGIEEKLRDVGVELPTGLRGLEPEHVGE
ncbi:BQ5605_C013g07165 [Microbotryum silenes-dioicae]|uniref:BQ5605_C013g07165 protein n=1 Tax=Microbotryum silenes-dioicae TaxID=796604 RepID=A0A2X0LRA7_9BASI|nr:BQ5605_C013g07165 [Microbotryum silenes-dioicae]